MKLFISIFINIFIILNIFSIDKKEIIMYEKKLSYYINVPNLSKEEIQLNNSVSKYINERKLNEAYDILFKWIQKYKDDNYQSKIARYISIRIAHIYIYAENWEPAINVFIEIMKYKNTVGNPLLHLRIGQIGYMLNEPKIYEDNLTRALIMGGLKVFENEDQKFKNIPLKLLDEPENSTWEKYEGQDWEITK